MVHLEFIKFENEILKPNRLIFRGGETPEQEKAKKELVEVNEVKDPQQVNQLAEERYLQLENMCDQALAKLPEGLSKGQREKLRVKINDFIVSKITGREYDKDAERGLDKEEFELFTSAMSTGIGIVISDYQKNFEAFIDNGTGLLATMGNFKKTLEDEDKKRLKADYWDFIKPSNMFGLSGYIMAINEGKPLLEGESFLEKERKEIEGILSKEDETQRAVVSAFDKISKGEDPETALKNVYGPEGNYFRALATGKDPQAALARFYLEKGEQIKNSGVSDVVQGLASGFLNQAILNAGQLTDASGKVEVSSKAKALLPKGFEKFRSEYLVGFADMFLSYDQLLLLAASGGVGSLLAKSTKLAQLGMKLTKMKETYRVFKYGSKLVPGFEMFARGHGDRIGIGALKLLGNFTAEVGKIALAEFGAGKIGNAVGGESGKFYAQKGVALFCFLIPGAKPAFERGMNKKMADVFAEQGATKGEAAFKNWVLKNYKPDQIRQLVRDGVTAKIEDAAMASGLPFLRNNPLVKAQIETQVDACINEFGLMRTAVKESAKKVANVNIGVMRDKISEIVDTLLNITDSINPTDIMAFLKGSGAKLEQLTALIRETHVPAAKQFLSAKKDQFVRGVDNLLSSIGKALENKSCSTREKGRLFLLLDSLAIIIKRGALLKKLEVLFAERPATLELVERWAEKVRLADHVVKHFGHGDKDHGEGSEKHDDERMAGEPESKPYAGDVKPVPMAGDVKPVPMAGEVKPVPMAGEVLPTPIAKTDQKIPPVV